VLSVAGEKEELFRVIYDDGVQHPHDAPRRFVHKQETVLGDSNEFTYHYDAYGRLEDVCRDGEHYSHYEYDDNGNRLLYQKCAAGVSCRPGQRCPAEIERGGVYDEQDRLLGYGDASFAYTANGELYDKIDEQGITTYGYDELGNLLDVWLPDGGRVHYLVDGRNRRIGRQVYDRDGNVAEEQSFIYLDQLNPVAELDGDGDMVSVFVYATRPNVPDLMYSCKDPAAPVAPCNPGAPWRAYRVVSDHLGSVRLVVSLDDATFGEVVQRMDYDEYGVVLTDTAPGFQPFGFAGGMYDIDTNTLRLGIRDYKPILGRWFSKDVFIFIINSLHSYVYALNDPVNFLDLFGLQPIQPVPGKGVRLFDFDLGHLGKFTFRFNLSGPLGPPLDPRALSEYQQINLNNFLNNIPCDRILSPLPKIYRPIKLPELKLDDIKSSINKYFTNINVLEITFPDLTLKFSY